MIKPPFNIRITCERDFRKVQEYCNALDICWRSGESTIEYHAGIKHISAMEKYKGSPFAMSYDTRAAPYYTKIPTYCVSDLFKNTFKDE